MCAWTRPGTTSMPLASMVRSAGVWSPASASTSIRPKWSTKTSACMTLRSGSMVTTVPPRMASEGLAATVRRTAIRGHQQRDVVVGQRIVNLEFETHALEKWGGASLGDEVGGDVEDESIAAWLDREIGDAAGCVGL